MIFLRDVFAFDVVAFDNDLTYISQINFGQCIKIFVQPSFKRYAGYAYKAAICICYAMHKMYGRHYCYAISVKTNAANFKSVGWILMRQSVKEKYCGGNFCARRIVLRPCADVKRAFSKHYAGVEKQMQWLQRPFADKFGVIKCAQAHFFFKINRAVSIYQIAI